MPNEERPIELSDAQVQVLILRGQATDLERELKGARKKTAALASELQSILDKSGIGPERADDAEATALFADSPLKSTRGARARHGEGER